MRLKKLAEVVEAGLRDGRSLESLRTAMAESGYKEDDIREIITHVDRKKTVRRPQRKGENNNKWIAASAIILIVIIIGSIAFISQPQPNAGPNSSGDIIIEPKEEVRTCYVVNESIKQVMIDAGAQCDKWFLIKEI